MMVESCTFALEVRHALQALVDLLAAAAIL